jgi:hypothetical protein
MSEAGEVVILILFFLSIKHGCLQLPRGIGTVQQIKLETIGQAESSWTGMYNNVTMGIYSVRDEQWCSSGLNYSSW